MSEFELSIIFPAFVACLLVLSTHVPLGMEVLRRGIIFIDLAIAQVAGLGVIATDTMGWEARGWKVQFAAVSAELVRDDTAAAIEEHGPFEINGSARIMSLLDDLLASFVDQQRMKIAAGSYKPCYRVLN